MLELKNISKAFNGRPVLKDVNVTIEDGKTLAIVGPVAPVKPPYCGSSAV